MSSEETFSGGSLFKLSQAAEYLGVTTQRVDRLAQQERLKFITVGGQRLFEIESLEAYRVYRERRNDVRRA